MNTESTKARAMADFRELVARYGIQWTPRTVPDQAAWDRMAEINKILTEADRREALGFPKSK